MQSSDEIHLHAKTPTFLLAFPQSSVFHVRFLCRAFCSVSFLMGITQKVLSLLNWSLVCTVSTVTQLAEWCSDQVNMGQKRAGRCQKLSFAFSLCHSIATPNSFCFLVFHHLPPRSSFTLFNDYISLAAVLVSKAGPALRAQTSHILYLLIFKSSLQICLYAHWHLNNPRCNYYFNSWLVRHNFLNFFVWSTKCATDPNPKRFSLLSCPVII